ncbi:MAG: aminotransferase class V-fold PLP-dependent enzyme [Lachnospiraceae bacterium]|nr:aminotransferase class V-fold PLP-dependent enzyme [Lachnospiraceae bacterium]
MNNKIIYLDNAATTYPKPEAVYRAMDETNRFYAVNAGRGSYAMARKASALIADTKRKIRELIHADVNTSVVFSPSITISLNQIINGYEWKDGDCIYVSPYEHNAVARTLNYLSKKRRIHIKELPIEPATYEIDLPKMKYEFSKESPAAVFCTHVSNVTGYVLPVEEIFSESKKYACFNVLDTAQSLGLIEIDVRKGLMADIIAFAGHKCLYGPFGIGGYINLSGVELDEFIVGGTGSDSLNLDMPSTGEAKYEAASSNIVAISGLNAALSELNVAECYEHEKVLTKYLVTELSLIDEIKLLIPFNPEKHIGIVSFIHKDMESESVGVILDEDFNIAVRTGYHCAPYIHKYLKDENSFGTVRVGLSRFSTRDDIDQLIMALKGLG